MCEVNQIKVIIDDNTYTVTKVGSNYVVNNVVRGILGAEKKPVGKFTSTAKTTRGLTSKAQKLIEQRLTRGFQPLV